MGALLSALRGRRHREAPAPAADPDELRRRGDVLERDGRLLDAIDALVAANRLRPDAALESRLVRLRRAAFTELDRSRIATGPAPAVSPSAVNEPRPLSPAELTADTLRAGILRHGSVWVRGLVPPRLVARLRAAIDGAFDGYDATAAARATPETKAWYDPLDDLKNPSFARHWRREANACLAADSPRAFFELLEVGHAVGIDRLVAEFLGERPSLAAEKCTLFRVDAQPRLCLADWHQDGAFLGDGIRTLNCWLALSRCGRDAPGMDVVPRRLDRILPVGEKGCHFDWTVSPIRVAQEFPGVPAWRPEFQEGDVLLFDHLALHRTAADPTMPNVRYAIESWYFAPSVYPAEKSTPLVV